MTKDELLQQAREADLPGRSSMSKEELEAALGDNDASSLKTPNGNWIHDHLLSLSLAALFLLSWLGQLYFQYRQEVHDAFSHGENPPAFFSSEFWSNFLSSTLENWQSEFLQLGTFVVLAAYLIHRDSPQSRDGDDEMAADIKAIRAKLGA